MRALIFYSICIVLFIGCMWLVKLLITGISADFGYGFAAGAFLTAVLGYSAEKLGYKQPHY
ncbi:hypothetical protein [Bradyrhizobium lupini]|uniref:hypothetical protein n=1 Tax=Rhizobium lupini TaxID=136996 RepID=UPI0034C5DD3D